MSSSTRIWCYQAEFSVKKFWKVIAKAQGVNLIALLLLALVATLSGDYPVEEFLDGLTGKQAQKVVWVLRLVEQLDPVPSQYFKKLVGTDLWEVRAQHGGDTFRVIGFFDGSRFWVVSGFAKKTEKIPQQELEVAEASRKDYLSRRKR